MYPVTQAALPSPIPTLTTLPNYIPQELNGESGTNREDEHLNQLRAKNDYDAVQCWLKEYEHKETTYKSYQKEAERFLLWCVYQHQKPLSSLDKEDFKAYFDFLSNPQPSTFWCGRPGGNHGHRGTSNWKPFVGPLGSTSKQTAVTIIHSLMQYFVQARYLKFNPIMLMRSYRKVRPTIEERSLQVRVRILTAEEWMAMLTTLGNLPETPSSAQFEKYRLRFIIEILCLLGLRVGELTTHTWNAFREEEGAWWFFVLGKGDKPGKIPVNEELLSAIKRYRLFMGLSPLPNPEDTIPIITPWHGKKPISSSHINKALKRLAIQTADIYFANQPYKHEKLKGFSAHWLRHLSASMQDQAGISFTIIQANMRHKSGETTRQYIHAMDRKRHEEMNKIKLKV